jgi:replicative DNA helicase
LDAERLLIAKCAHSGQVERLIQEGVRTEQFLDPELGGIWDFLVNHFRKYKAAPSFAVIKERFPNHNFEIVTDSLDYVRDRFRDDVRYRVAVDTVRDLAKHVDEHGAGDFDAIMMEAARRVAQAVPSGRVGRLSDMQKRIEAYDKALAEGVVKGIQMGIPMFDKVTLGVQPHEYVSVVGWQGTGKSTLVQWLIFNAYAQGKTSLYISLEMEIEALFRKWDTMCTNFEYHALKALELSPKDRQKWEEAAARVAKGPHDIIALDDVVGCNVDKIYAETVRYEPDMVAIDYITLMETSRSIGQSMWEKVTYITQALKQQARTLKIPVYGVAQTNINSAQEGAALDNIAYSRSIGQDSDLVLGLFQNEGMRENSQMQVRLLKNRDGAIRSADLLWEMETMKFGPWDELTLFQKKGAFDGEPQASNAG